MLIKTVLSDPKISLGFAASVSASTSQLHSTAQIGPCACHCAAQRAARAVLLGELDCRTQHIGDALGKRGLAIFDLRLMT